MPFIVQIGLIGAAGGLLNAFLVGGEWIPWPKVSKVGFNLGVVGTMAVGTAAALALHWLGLSAPDTDHQYGAALAAGLGGGSLLTSISERFYSSLVSDQRDAQADIAKNLASRPRKQTRVSP